MAFKISKFSDWLDRLMGDKFQIERNDNSPATVAVMKSLEPHTPLTKTAPPLAQPKFTSTLPIPPWLSHAPLPDSISADHILDSIKDDMKLRDEIKTIRESAPQPLLPDGTYLDPVELAHVVALLDKAKFHLNITADKFCLLKKDYPTKNPENNFQISFKTLKEVKRYLERAIKIQSANIADFGSDNTQEIADKNPEAWKNSARYMFYCPKTKEYFGHADSKEDIIESAQDWLKNNISKADSVVIVMEVCRVQAEQSVTYSTTKLLSPGSWLKKGIEK